MHLILCLKAEIQFLCHNRLLRKDSLVVQKPGNFLVQNSLLKHMHISNTHDTDFHLFITLGDESVGLVTLCRQAKSFHFTLNDFI